MVNTGRPSRACDPCKARHTKCDERRPKCSRCERAGRQCTGYKNDFDINLRNESHAVARRVGAREGYFQSLQKPLPAPYGQQAVALFLENFVLFPLDARYSKGYLSGLLPLLRSTKSNSLLSSAVDAVALCFLATTMTDDSIASRAARSYLRALNRLQSRLDQDVDCISTETMISVYLMGLYEMIMPPEKTVHPWLAHLQGLTAIIKAHSEKSGRCFPGIGFFIALDSSLGRSAWAINHNTPVDGWFLDHADHDERILYSEVVTQDALKSSPGVNSPSMSASLDNLILRTQPILQAAPSLLENSHSGVTENVERLLTAARLQLSSFRAWPSRIPDYWQPNPVHPQIDASELFQQDIFPGRVDVYSDCQ
ncbi:hypothetical protein NA57DRAFT_60711 [Rhizodiscina lignyota]|uniref:Zn(2)-C6 fungal-type domain-containing protein n=1 Tax=Rhizodiscina lignyota TaxID=1504668 RepID=A0A9P4I579_9PEZI|nr:hypothetical protein NA57DRAFT_60711 [Rhizodiscina lignyota]